MSDPNKLHPGNDAKPAYDRHGGIRTATDGGSANNAGAIIYPYVLVHKLHQVRTVSGARLGNLSTHSYADTPKLNYPT